LRLKGHFGDASKRRVIEMMSPVLPSDRGVASSIPYVARSANAGIRERKSLNRNRALAGFAIHVEANSKSEPNRSEPWAQMFAEVDISPVGLVA
jgi:hypothetical protein